jgi:threonine dehydrogenase-like Zn-dependent dehydrogenase
LGDLGVLLEPAAVVAKAWEQAERIGSRSWFKPRLALVTGAGPVGLLAALLARQRGLETHVLDLVNEGAKPRLVADLGAYYHSEPVLNLQIEPDIVIECTGVGRVSGDAALRAAPGAIIALTGFSQSERLVEAKMDTLNKALVLGNKVVFGTVSAARRHYDQAAEALARAKPEWLTRLITRRLAPEEWPDALQKRSEDIKVIVDMTAAQ